MRTTPAAAWRPGDRPSAPAPTPVRARDDLRGVRYGYCATVGVAAAVQVLFFHDVENNLLATLLATVSSLLGIGYALNSRRFRAHPVSALVLLLYTTTATSAALMVKSLEWSALADRLQVPLTTFSVLAATQVAVIAADRIYLRVAAFSTARDFISERVLEPLGMMRWPSDFEFWLLGFLGLASVLLTGTDFESDASFGLASAGDKVVRAFGFLKFAPFLIPFRDALSGLASRRRPPVPGLVLYFCALVAISFATNSRSTFADAVPTVGLCVLIAMALGHFDFRRVSPIRLALAAGAAALAGILLSRVSLAMVVVRDYRHNADVGMLVRMTAEALFNSEWLAAAKAKMDTSVTIANYSEDYVNSRFLARFILTKFHDNVLYYFSLMGADQIASYKAFMLDRLLATLPDPLLRPLGIAINKEDLVVSNGDYIVYLVDGWGLGGFKTGSMIGEVFGVFGPAFVPVIMAAALMLFVVHDGFVAAGPHGRTVMAPLIVLLIWNLVGTTAAFGLGAETITAIPAGIVRGMPQNVLAYLIAAALARAGSRLAGRGT